MVSEPSSLRHNNTHARQAAEHNTTQGNTTQALVCPTAVVNCKALDDDLVGKASSGTAGRPRRQPHHHAAAHASQITQARNRRHGAMLGGAQQG